MPDRELERELRELGSRIEYPPTPDLARAVRSRLDEEATERPARRRGFRLPMVSTRWAVAAMFVVVLAVPVLSPTVRDTVASWFVAGQAASSGAGDPPGRFADEAEPEASSVEAVRRHGESLGFGEPLTLREARTRAGSDGPILLPRASKPGEPDAIYAAGPAGEDGVVLVYRARTELPALGDTRVGLLLTELSGDVRSTFLAEGMPDATRFEEVGVGGEQAYWFPDGRHLLSQPGEAERLPGGALLWEREGRALLLRVELTREEAIQLAESVH
jgi:hypothetical protein